MPAAPPALPVVGDPVVERVDHVARLRLSDGTIAEAPASVSRITAETEAGRTVLEPAPLPKRERADEEAVAPPPKRPKQTPSCQRSLEEVKMTAYLCDALHELPLLRDVLLRGDAMIKTDAVFDLGGTLVAFEHDPGFWHDEANVERDMDKTRKLLEAYPGLIVLRLRVDAPRLPINHPRCVVVHVEQGSLGAMLATVAVSMAPFAPEPYASRLRQAHAGKRRVAELASVDLFAEMCPGYEARLAERTAFLRERELDGVGAEILVTLPMETLSASATYLLDELGVKKAKLATYPNLLQYCVEANLKPTASYLLNELGVKKAKLATYPNLLGYSVETNLKSTAAYLLDELGVKKAALASSPRLLACSVETNLKPTAAYLLDELGVKKAALASCPNLLSFSVETNLKPTAAYLLDELGVKKAKLASSPALLTLSVEANLKPTAAYLLDELGVKKAALASSPVLLACSVEANLKPTVEFLSTLVGTEAVQSNPSALTCSLGTMQLRVALLDEAGVPREKVKMNHVAYMKLGPARAAWAAHGRADMDTDEKLRLLMQRRRA